MSVVALFSNLRVRTKILVGFGLLLGTLAVSGGVGLYMLTQIDAANSFVQQRTQVATIANSIALEFALARSQVREYARTGSPSAMEQAKVGLGRTKEATDTAIAALLVPERRSKAKEIGTLLASYSKHFVRIEEIVAQSRKLQHEVLDPTDSKARNELRALGKIAESEQNGAASMAILRGTEALLEVRLNANKWFGSRDEQQSQKTADAFRTLNVSLAAIEPLVRDTDLKPMYDAAAASADKYSQTFKSIVALNEESDTLIDGTMVAQAEGIGRALAYIRENVAADLVRAEQEIHSDIENNEYSNILLGAAGLLLGCVFAWIVGGAIAGPILGIAAAMRKLADGDTGIAIPGIGRRDEIGAMAAALQVFKDNRIAADRQAVEQAAEQQAKA
ncbi:MAG: MCP four helix bundle domain-containing protein, partial [Rhodospirillales bacterium]